MQVQSWKVMETFKCSRDSFDYDMRRMKFMCLLFSADVTKLQYCEVELTAEKYQAFVYAVKNHYWYQMYIDDLPIWGM